MATATMGLRRRVQVGNSSSVAQTSNNKRSRSENNNSPSQGNLNSVSSEPAAKKSRTCTTRSATKAKEMEKKIPHGPPHWSDPRPYASIAGLSLNAQQALCQAEASLPSPMAYLASTTMATFVGNATNLGKNPNTASYLDLSKIIARTPDSSTDPETKNTLGQLFSAATSAFSSTSQSQGSSNNSTSTNNNTTSSSSNGNATQTSSEIQQQIAPITLPKNFPNDSMFNTYQPWVIKTYGDLAKTKTITIKKYARILRTLRGEEANSAENSKFRFWVKSKGFHIGQPEGYDPKPADRIVGRHAVTNLGLDPPLYVPTQPPHNKALNGAEGTVPPGRIYKKVAIVENFFDIIHAVHVDLEGRPGKHAGQKRTYRTITETYAFLPREAVTRFLLGCTECQRRPRTPSPTSAVATPAVATTPTPKVSTPLPSPTERPESPKAATTLSDAAEEMQDSAKKAKETNHSLDCKDVAVDYVKDIKEESNIIIPEVTTLTTTLTTTTTTTTETSNISGANTSTETDNTNNINKPKMLTRDEKYNPLSITNLLRKDPPTTRRTPIALAAVQHIPEIHMPETPIIKSELSTTSTTEIATTNGSFSTTDYNVNHNRSNSIMTTAVPKKLRMLPENRINRSTPSPKAWSPNVDLKYAPIDYSLPLTVSYLKHQRHLAATMENSEINVQKNKKEMKEKTLTKDIEATVKSEKNSNSCSESESEEEPDYSPATGLIDTNLNLLATIQQLHCQVMLALTERLRPPLCSSPSMTSTSSTTATAAAVTFTSGHNKANNDS